MSLDQKDAFRDLQFNGQPSGYRDFRRKTLLAVASLEDKHSHLAGPRLLARLSGEAWRATEHLPIGEIRRPEGWSLVIKALDDHYRYLPETELHEAIDEFLFLLKRRAHEGATSFSSRFRTQLERMQNLIAQERELTRKRRRRSRSQPEAAAPIQEEAASSLEETDEEEAEFDLFGPSVGEAEPEGTAEEGHGEEGHPEPPATAAGSPHTDRVGSRPPSSNKSERGSKRRYETRSRGTFEQDHALSQRKMQQMLGTLEPGKLKPTPIFPQTVLGHLYMRKYGLSRDQRAMVIRSCNGSSRFTDVERIMRASDLEESRDDRRPRADDKRTRPARRDTMVAEQKTMSADDDQSSEVIDYECETSEDSNDEILAAMNEEDSDDEEAIEVLELHKKTKEKFRKAFVNYKESKKKVKDIKRSRQPYYPVVALNQPNSSAATAGASAQVPLQKQPFKYDRQKSSAVKGQPRKDKTSKVAKREEANLTETLGTTSFNYMVETIMHIDAEEVFMTSIPMGYAIIDTGCTTSVIGQECADRLRTFLRNHELPEPEDRVLPPVELKGFSGETATTTRGLVWHVKLGNLWGTITTYIIPGKTAFLPSRRVLEGMEAEIHLGDKTLSSMKHGIRNMRLQQATNGHLLMPLWNLPSDWQSEEVQLEEVRDQQVNSSPETNEPNTTMPSPPPPHPEVQPTPKDRAMGTGNDRVTRNKSITIFIPDAKSALQHIAKHTKRCVVDLKELRDSLRVLYGEDASQITHAFVAYRPRLERIPEVAQTNHMLCSRVTLTKNGVLDKHPWTWRNPGAIRREVEQTNLALFVFREPDTEPSVQTSQKEHPCLCCNENDVNRPPKEQMNDDIEALYEDVIWEEPRLKQLNKSQTDHLKHAIASLRKTSSQMVLSRLLSEPDAVEHELEQWLGDQAGKLRQSVVMIEVFTDVAPLSEKMEQLNDNRAVIRIGQNLGQDLSRLRDRQLLLCLIARTRPTHVWYSWPCGDWGPWSRFNMARSSTLKEDICPKTRLPVMKPTRIVTTSPELAKTLHRCRCDGKHQHAHLEGKFMGKNLSSLAEVYPKKFCRIVATALTEEAKTSPPKQHMWSEELFAAEPVVSNDGEQAVDDSQVEAPDPEGGPEDNVSVQKAQAIVAKLHVNTGHASSEQMMRLANRCRASEQVKEAIRNFKCPICAELNTPALHRKVTMPHTDQPNQIVGVDFVQVELTREDSNGKLIEHKFNVLTCVCLATDFCQQVVVPPGKQEMSRAFHQAWARPYGKPEVAYMDPTARTLSADFQEYLKHNDIKLLHCATEAHWQLGRTEIANRVLRGMAQKCWRTTSRPAVEVIEACSAIRNMHMRKNGFSPSQWFLGHDVKQPGWLGDVSEQRNFPVQSQILNDVTFADRLRLKEAAAKSFIEEHAKDTWRRAICGRNRPLRGPYQAGQLVYFFRRRGRGSFRTRWGEWLGPGRVIGTESSRGSHVPRIVWVSYNGFLYRCAPEALRPVPEDEATFRELASELSEGQLSPDLEKADLALRNAGSFQDLLDDIPEDEDMELQSDLDDEPDEDGPDDPPAGNRGKKHKMEGDDGSPRKVRQRFYRSPEFWTKRAAGMPPLGPIQEGVQPDQVTIEEPFAKRVRLDPEEERIEPMVDDDDSVIPSPSIAGSVIDENRDSHLQSDADMPEEDNLHVPELEGEEPVLPEVEPMPDGDMQPETEANHPETADEPSVEPENIHIPSDDEGLMVHDEKIQSKQPSTKNKQEVLEVSFDITPGDITDNPLCLWTVLDECLAVASTKATKRRVEVSLRRLNSEDRALFDKAMQKEWQSWVENRVVSLCKRHGVDAERIIRARWVLVWKKSSDPDNPTKTPKARLVLVGWQDPEVGRIATDSPTLRKESKSLVLSICSSKKWKLWGADIKTAFLSGDASNRDLYFKPPPEIKQWMSLTDDDLFRLEKAAYGLAEAPRQWFLRLSREMSEAGLRRSSLDPCLFTLRKGEKLLGVCGVHVDDILGGGEAEMDAVLTKLRKKLPFGDFRTFTIRYTGIEIRQDPQTYEIEIGQESYIDALEPVSTKSLGTAGTPLQDPGILRTCAGQLAWVSNATRPDQSFLSSYLQGVQDKGNVSHVQLYNKSLREMKERKVCLRFPSTVKVEDWRIMCVSDSGWGTRSSGESQGGYVLCICHKSILERKRAPCWIIDWASKKLKRMVRSSVAAETLSGQNGLDAVESFQALLCETLHGMSPRDFRNHVPKHPACLVIDSKGFYDAVTRSCSSQSLANKTMKTETFSDQRLSAHEVSHAAGLLMRAVKHGQGEQVMMIIRGAPSAKGYAVGSAALVTEAQLLLSQGQPGPSSMTDAVKRRIPDDDHAWELASDTPDKVPSEYYQGTEPSSPPWVRVSNPLLETMQEIKEDTNIPLPSDISDVHMWGKCLVETEKYKSEKISYLQMIQMAKSDREIHQYLSYIKKTYGYVPGKTKDDEKVTPGRDLARYLQRYGWNAHGNTQLAFSRRFQS
eukprot:Skav209448  [mRNA]  locus=scaffold2199:144696:152896:- [translate_table: standard]